jgi:hypothetical protein
MKNYIRTLLLRHKLRGIQSHLQHIINERVVFDIVEKHLEKAGNDVRLKLLDMDVTSRRPK